MEEGWASKAGDPAAQLAFLARFSTAFWARNDTLAAVFRQGTGDAEIGEEWSKRQAARRAGFAAAIAGWPAAVLRPKRLRTTAAADVTIFPCRVNPAHFDGSESCLQKAVPSAASRTIGTGWLRARSGIRLQSWPSHDVLHGTPSRAPAWAVGSAPEPDFTVSSTRYLTCGPNLQCTGCSYQRPDSSRSLIVHTVPASAVEHHDPWSSDSFLRR